MKKRFLRSGGFTLVEVLIATALLATFVSMAIIGSTTLFGTGEQMMAVSKAAVLGSDVMEAVKNEIRFGESFSTDADGKKIVYNSTTYGNGCELICDEAGRLAVVQTLRGAGAAGEEPVQKTVLLIGTAAYDEVRIQTISFTVGDAAEGGGRTAVSCKVAITSDGVNTLWEKTETLVPLYQKTLA